MYKKFRFYFRLIIALTVRYYLFLLLGLFLSIILFFSLPRLIKYLPNFRFTRQIGLVGRYSITDLPVSVSEKISLGLTSINPSGQAEPGVAESWEISPDGKTLSFALNSQLRWHDHTPLVSTDIKYQFVDASIDYPDPQHLVFHLKDPFSPLPSLLSKPIIYYQTSKIFKTTKVKGLGSYLVKSFKTNGGILETLTLYPTDSNSHQPILLYKFYSSSAQARTAFKLGLINQIEDLSDLAELENWPNTEVYKSAFIDRYVGLFFNTQSPNLGGTSGKNLRTAITYAIDKNHWPNRAISPIRPNSWAFNPDIKKYDQDVKKAKDLLKKVEKIPEKIILNTVPAFMAVAEQIKSDLAAIGLQCEILASPEIPTEFDMLLIAQATPLDPDQYNFWHSTKTSTNLTRLNNPRIDKLLEDGRKTYSTSERTTIYQDFQKYLAEEIPAVFLFYPEKFTISRK